MLASQRFLASIFVVTGATFGLTESTSVEQAVYLAERRLGITHERIGLDPAGNDSTEHPPSTASSTPPTAPTTTTSSERSNHSTTRSVSAYVFGALSWVLLYLLALALEASGNSFLSRNLAWARQRGARFRRRRRRILQNSGRLERAVVDLYRSSTLSDGIATIKGVDERVLPVYSPPAWRITGLAHDQAVNLWNATEPPIASTGARLPPEVDAHKPRSIRRRETLTGTEIWNGTALCVTGLPDAYGNVLQVYASTYFKIGGQMIRMEEEAVRFAQWRRPPREHRRQIRSFDKAARGVGGIALLAVDHASGVKVLIHRRSEDLATAPGSWCVTPTYIMEDPQATGRDPSVLGLALYNVLRETLEEAYGISELRGPMALHNTDRFLESGLGQAMIDGLRRGSVVPLHLGWCVNLVSGQLDMMSLVLVRNDADLERLVTRDVDPGADEIDIGTTRWIGLDSDELDAMIRQPIFHAGSALALQEARSLLNRPKP